MESITFQVEEIEKATTPLEERNFQKILNGFSENIKGHSDIDFNLVSAGHHAFIYGMYRAYSEHRPFVISPDMIWLLVCQAFSTHVNANKKKGINYFSTTKEKQKLMVVVHENPFKYPNIWGETTRHFTNQIASYVGDELIDTLRANFSTTGFAEQVACEITIMHTMRAYFEYMVSYCICGIPEITIQGTKEDWIKIRRKLSFLKKFDLDWWVRKIDPVINEFISVYEGEVNKPFWRNMFKIHTLEEYGNPKFIDGWILNFYPYDKHGEKIDFKAINGIRVEDIIESLPSELLTIDFDYQIQDENGNVLERIPMEYWAGFIGLKQDKKSLSLKPEIAWFTSLRDDSKIKHEGRKNVEIDCRAYYNLDKFPMELFNQEKWYELELNFNDEIEIPEKISELVFSSLRVNGKVPVDKKKAWENMQVLLSEKKNSDLIINDVWPYEV